MSAALRRRAPALLLALAFWLGAGGAGAQSTPKPYTFDGSLRLELPGSQGPGIEVTLPVSGTSTWADGRHSIPTLGLAPSSRGGGSLAAAFVRLPTFDTLELGATQLMAGQVGPSGVSGLAFASDSLRLVGTDSWAVFPVEEESESMVFGPVTIGTATPPQPGELRETLQTVGGASLVSTDWTLASSNLAPDGSGSLELVSLLSLGSDVAPTRVIGGEARLAVTFVPEPGAALSLAAGALLLAGLRARRRSEAQ